MKTQVYVKTTFQGYHRWLNAPAQVAFLRDYHRHLFHVKLTVNVNHDDRDVEFFILKHALDNYIRLHLADAHFELSCEHLAKQIAESFLRDDYDVHSCEVSEDGENGAVVTVTP